MVRYGSFVVYFVDNRFKYYILRYYEYCIFIDIGYINMYMYGIKLFV